MSSLSGVHRPMRTRMAPSPTGFMHVGTLRTVLYDYFLARQSGGQFIIRIEDTDQEREVEGAVEGLLKTMQALRIDYDEGPVLNSDGTFGEKGSHGPYFQSQRLLTYRPYVDQLLAAGHAYHCFCTSETLDEMRQAQSLSKQPVKYDRRCLKLSAAEVEQRLAVLKPGDSHVIRMKIPEGESVFVDGIRGEIRFPNADVDDQVLLKSDGFPTYHLAVVVDDHLMEITHVLRGEEWISSTPKQVILHQMLGWEMPVYSHVPLLLNPDKTKLSKRKGDVSVESYLSKGYLPEALINFLALLGWNPTGDREIYAREELVKLFDLAKVNRAGAVMNVEKLNWTNAHYIRQLSAEAFLQACEERGCILVNHPVTNDPLSVYEQAMQRRALQIIQGRVEVFPEVPTFLSEMNLFGEMASYDSAILVWKKSTKEESKDRLTQTRAWLADRPADWFQSIPTIEQDLRTWIIEKGWGNGDTLWPLRVALSGREKSPSPFELLFVLQKERALKRIDEAMGLLA